MNSAETAAACRMCAHRQNNRSGVRNIPPPVPVSPERNPRPAPTLMAVGREGVTISVGSARRKIKRTAEKRSTSPIKIFKTEADGCIATKIGGGNRKQRKWPEEFPREMACAPKLERADGRYQNVENQRGWSDNGRGNAPERHHRDVT